MRSILFITSLLSFLLLNSCSAPQNKPKEVKAEETTEQSATFPEKAKNMTIYEVNIRQFTPEGTFNAFSEHLPRLKNLGVEILWLMPVQPIGELNRKGPLGSYYSISDYKATNPEFGTIEEFKNLVSKAHDSGLYVILDWVPNHTAWDHPWVKSNPEYYAKDEQGNITYEADWTDIALLDHTNPDTRKSMIAEMEFWVKETNIDGFRCDHAGHEIPLYFWEEAIPYLDQFADLFWLAEWDQPRMHLQFDATYNWELHHISNRVAKRENDVNELTNYIEEDLKRYGLNPFRLNFTTNHDENAWNGTVFERYGDGHKANAVFMFTTNGIPMIYSGQEVGLSKRLKFFEKDEIVWTDSSKLENFYQSLNKLRKENEALWSGKYGAMSVFIDTGNDRVIAYTREKNNNAVTSIINLDGKYQEITLAEALSGTEYFSNEQITLKGNVKMEPFSYKVIVNK